MIPIYRKLFGPTEGELIDLAFKRAAEAEADVTKQEILIAHYSSLLKNIDHTKDWWSYAQAMQNKHDAEREATRLHPIAEQAGKAAAALIDNYKGDAQ